MNCLWDSIS